MASKKMTRAPLRLIDCEKQRLKTEQANIVSILQAMLARVLAGRVTGVIFIYKPAGEDEEVGAVCTGVFHDQHAKALHAVMRTSMVLTQLKDK